MTVAKVVLVDLDTGEETILKGKERSRCFFVDWFSYKNYEIQLRLDYNENPSVDPVLDADIRDSATKQLVKKGAWHHTYKEHDSQSNMNIYTFTFEDLTLRLYTKTTHQQTITSNATFVGSLKTTLVRGESSPSTEQTDKRKN
jgi:hypothetical protein